MKHFSYIEQLESETIFIIREAVASFENPILLFSGGKDSLVMLHIAMKAFYPANLPFPIMHIDTGHNFPETLKFRDDLVSKYNLRLIVASVQESIDNGRVIEETGINASRNYLQTITLLDAIEKHHFDVAFGGGRRDEEKARAKERFFSHRNEFGQWDPKNQRPELWYLFNSKKHQGEHFRVFPLSNWTEKDIWQYICNKNIEVPTLYFSHLRECFYRDGVLLAKSDYVPMKPDEKPKWMQVRFRTIGDMTCTGATLSDAATSEEVLHEIIAMRITERGGRFDDKRSETAMEDRKKEGYF
ncbi:MAG TPA: sulfate adenylyltransferase subunit CysD [Bacteroidales bacterium]|nr:sulfate adenylyltransferase subunit CysD [Bacteroidales bacterium]